MATELNMRLTNRLEPFESLNRRFKIAFGGRGGTKSVSTVDILIKRVHLDGIKVCCFREFGSSIEDSIWSLISSEIDRIGVPGFDITGRKIEHSVSGGSFKSKGLGRDSKSVKSFSGFDVFLVEEGDFLTEQILKDLTPTLRKEGSELWVIFNPQSREDAVSKRFLNPYYADLLKDKVYEDDLHYIVWTNYDENPWFPDVLKQELELDKLYVKQGIMPKAEFDHKWHGHFNDSIEHSIIRSEWFDTCVDAHLKLNWEPRGIEVVSHDPSDLGPDHKGLTHRHGSFIKQVKRKTTGDVNEGMDWALQYAIENQVDLFTWDCDGMGVSLNRQVEEGLNGKHTKFQMYKGSQGPDNPDEMYEGTEDAILDDKKKKKTNKETFYNKRAQKSWLLRDRIYNTYLAVKNGVWTDPDEMISISSEIDEMEVLRAETCRIPRKPNNNGLIQIYPKIEMKKKFKINSPNLFDSLVMSLENLETETIMDLEFEGWRN